MTERKSRWLEVEASAGWIALAIMALALVGIVGLIIWLWPEPFDGIDPAEVRQVCQQYANLDLSGMASLCRQAGYQQTVGAIDWPVTVRTVMPEDLETGERRPRPCNHTCLPDLLRLRRE